MLLKSKIQVAIKETNSKVVYVKLKELFKKIYKLNETIDDSSLLNDMYAQIDNNNLVSDDKFKLYYLPASKNESSFTQMSNFDDYNKFINKSIMTVATKGLLSYQTTKLSISEILLTFFIIFLWLFSILCCLKRYSLLLCFRKRDSLPFYNKNLDDIDLYPKTTIFNDKSNNSKTFSIKYSSSLINQQQLQHKHGNSNNESIKLSEPNSLHQITTFLLRKQQQDQKSILKINKPVIYHHSCNDSKLSLDHMQQKYIIKPSSTTTITTTDTAIENYKKKSFKNRRKVLSSNNKHFNLLSLDETALKYCNPVSSSLLKPQNSIQESDTSSILYHDYYSEDQTSLFEMSNLQAINGQKHLLKPQRSFQASSNNSLNKYAAISSSHTLKQNSLDVASPPSTATIVIPQKQLTIDGSYLTRNRQMNPISSIKRNMFVNSRQYPNTTYYSAHVESNDREDDVLSMPPTYAISKKPHQEQQSKKQNIETNNGEDIIDPNLLNPKWIPAIVRKTLLDLHHKAVSKSDSNIKSKISNKRNKEKKPLSLQNSQDQYSVYNLNSPQSSELLVKREKSNSNSKTT